MSVAMMMSAGSTGIDEPPGMHALSLRPPRIPPAISRSDANGKTSLTSQLLGRSTPPVTEKILVPPLLGRPRFRNASPPLRMIHGTAAKVSVLLIVVGFPYMPTLAGKGGLKRGMPFLPSSDSSSAVSSPQM